MSSIVPRWKMAMMADGNDSSNGEPFFNLMGVCERRAHCLLTVYAGRKLNVKRRKKECYK